MAKWIAAMSDHEDSEEEEEDALSLCDLPINMAKKPGDTQLIMRQDVEEEEEAPLVGKKEELEFDFGWWGNNYSNSTNNNGSSRVSSADPQMCAADELFFKGQILPRRLSVSSDTALLRSMSRSESMDHGSVTRFIGSRSSSVGSHYSSASSSNSSSININGNHHQIQPHFRRPQFQPQPIPKPQAINAAGYQRKSFRMSQTNTKSTVWDFFRTGLVRGPDIELHDLNKLRNGRTMKSSAIISRNSSGNSQTNDTKKNNETKNNSRQRLFNKTGGFLTGGSCKCSVETVPTDIVLISKKNSSTASRGVGAASKEGAAPLLPRHSEEHRARESKTVTEVEKKKIKQKEALSRHRTSEWLKELALSHESYSKRELGTRMISRVP